MTTAAVVRIAEDVDGGAAVHLVDHVIRVTPAELMAWPRYFEELPAPLSPDSRFGRLLRAAAPRAVELEVPEHRQFPWEEAVRASVGPIPVVRRSRVRAQVLDQPHTWPLRVLQLDLAPDLNSGFDITTFRRNSSQLRTARRPIDDLEAFQQISRWPGIDILHLVNAGYALADNDDPLSAADPGQPGSLAWVERLCIRARVRVLCLETSSGGRQFGVLRELAGALVDRGGPAVVIAETQRTRERFWRSFYGGLLADEPLDVAVGWDEPFSPSVVTGPGGVDAVRPSSAAAGLRELAVALEDPTGRTGGALVRFLESQGRASAVSVLQDNAHGLGSLAASPDRPDRMAQRLDDLRRLVGLGELDGNGGVARSPQGNLWHRAPEDRAPRQLELSLLDAPDELVAGRPYTVCVEIGGPDVLTTPVRLLTLVEEPYSWEPGTADTFAEIGVTPLASEVDGSLVRQERIPVSGAAQRILLTITPQRAGICGVRVCLYIGQNIVQSARLALRCAAEDGSGMPSPAELGRALGLLDDAIGDVGWASRVEYSLHGLDAPTASRELSIVMDDEQSVATVKAPGTFGVYLAGDLTGVIESIRLTLEDIASPAGDNPEPLVDPVYVFGDGKGDDVNAGTPRLLESALDRLADIGWQLFTKIFRHDRDELQRILETFDARIAVAHVLVGRVVPWAAVYDRKYVGQRRELHPEGGRVAHGSCRAALPSADGRFPPGLCGEMPDCLLHPDRDAALKAAGEPRYLSETVTCPRHFWGFRHQIELPAKQQTSVQAAGNVATRVTANGQPSIVIGMHGGLHLIDSHLEQLTESSEGALIVSTNYHRDLVMDDLDRYVDVDIVYLYCHAEGGSGTNIAKPALRFRARSAGAAEGRIEPPDLATDLPWEHNPLVILNGCRTSSYRPDALSQFILELIDTRRAGGVLATEISVWEELATEVGTNFLTHFLDGRGAGEALLLARNVLLARDNPLGLAYTLYAALDFHLGGDGPGDRLRRRNIIAGDGGGSTIRTDERVLVALLG